MFSICIINIRKSKYCSRLTGMHLQHLDYVYKMIHCDTSAVEDIYSDDLVQRVSTYSKITMKFIMNIF